LDLLQIVFLFRLKVISHSCEIGSGDVACFIWQLARLMNSELPISSTPWSRAFQLEFPSETEPVRLDDARMLAEIARNAVREFVTLASSDGPMWMSVSGGSLDTLNMMTYLQVFPGQSSTMGLEIEATRANAVVMMNSKNIVEYLMDAVSGILILIEC
jgi:hypothetical protein